jgi:hypothetical protein
MLAERMETETHMRRRDEAFKNNLSCIINGYKRVKLFSAVEHAKTICSAYGSE